MSDVASEVLAATACQHCGRPLTECDGRSHYAQGARHKVLCPLCGGAAHSNDVKLMGDFRCMARQALGFETQDITPVQLRQIADWLEGGERHYGKAAAGRVLLASGVTGIAAAKIGKKAAAVPPPPVPVPLPAIVVTPSACTHPGCSLPAWTGPNCAAHTLAPVAPVSAPAPRTAPPALKVVPSSPAPANGAAAPTPKLDVAKLRAGLDKMLSAF